MKPSPLTESERIYAESVKYGNSVIMLIPLPSGRFAVMGAGRKLDGAYAWDTWLLSVEASQPIPRKIAAHPYMNLIRQGPADPDIDFDL